MSSVNTAPSANSTLSPLPKGGSGGGGCFPGVWTSRPSSPRDSECQQKARFSAQNQQQQMRVTGAGKGAELRWEAGFVMPGRKQWNSPSATLRAVLTSTRTSTRARLGAARRSSLRGSPAGPPGAQAEEAHLTGSPGRFMGPRVWPAVTQPLTF